MNITEIADNSTIPKEKNSATLHLVQSSRFAQRFARLLVWCLGIATCLMAILPWQQTSRGSGQVIAFVPQERRQTIDARAKGVVVKVAAGLVEGSKVKKDQFILEIRPFAPNQVAQLKAQLTELKFKERTALDKAESYGENVIGYGEALGFAVQAANELVDSAKAKLKSKIDSVKAYEAKRFQAKLNYERQLYLFEKGLKPEKEIEKLKKEWDVTEAELLSLAGEVDSHRKEVLAKQSQLEEKRRIAQTKVDYSKAQQQDALGAASTARKEARDVEIKLESLTGLIVKAPRDGTIFRMPVYEFGQTIKEGQPLLTLVPETDQKAVELYINGNDMPLVQLDQEVRLQFEGWPAVQFAGWPSIAVGTFSGKVVNVDETDNGKGQFRILIAPNGDDVSWPSDRYLRQGVRANGWVMLKRVTVGYEIWRQLNGFPVIISEKEPKKEKTKPPKFPK